MFRKSINGGIILLFLLSSLIPMTSSFETNKTYTVHIDENGTLSGYVKDAPMNPIEGAIIRALCGENYFENVSDSSGYYYIDNIPIIFCLWNVSASKTGYKTIWVEMSIGENTTYDFVLTPLGKTLYVGGSGAGNYTTIQSAIDDANSGCTVFVYSGTYYENVVVNKSIELTGEDRNTTIIDGSGTGYVIYVTADTVTVDGFTIQNSGIGSERAGICIINNNILISNNIISNNEDGIRLIDSEYTEISSNILNNNQDDDIVIRDYSNNNIVTGNKIISYNEAGIILYISNRDNIIFNNTITNHDYGIIICYSSNFNTVYNNVITKNKLGIYIHDSSSTNKIYHNNLMENTQNADDECINTWDNEEKGNYWDDYEERYPDAHKKWLKGIWDTPYEIPAGDNQDRYPLIKPYNKSKPYINLLFPQFLEQHPYLFPLLRQLLDL